MRAGISLRCTSFWAGRIIAAPPSGVKFKKVLFRKRNSNARSAGPLRSHTGELSLGRQVDERFSPPFQTTWIAAEFRRFGQYESPVAALPEFFLLAASAMPIRQQMSRPAHFCRMRREGQKASCWNCPWKCWIASSSHSGRGLSARPRRRNRCGRRAGRRLG